MRESPPDGSERPARRSRGHSERCRAYVERLQRAGADTQLVAYPGARHQFDRPGDGTVRHSPREQNASRCDWEERTEGHIVNRDTGRSFNLDNPCVTRGGSFASDPAAYRAARDAVKALLLPIGR
jgi:hypothetical protein